MNRHEKALSLLEILIATIIFFLAVAGLMNVFVSAKKLIKHSRYNTGGGEISKNFLDPLQAYVRQDQWATNCFSSPFNIANCPNVPTSSGAYTASYVIGYTPSVDPEMRKVKLTLTWQE